MDVPQDKGVSGEEVTKEEDDDGGDDDAMDEAERLLRWRMVEGEEDVPSTSSFPHDATIDQRVGDLQRRLDESVT